MLDPDKLLEEASRVASDAYELKRLLVEARQKLEFEARQRGDKALVKLSPSEVRGLVLFGDIHGDTATMAQLMKVANVGKLLSEGYRLVFLGDYIDRGPRQIEALAAVSLAKLWLGEKAIVLRGNHEVSPWLRVHPHDYPEVLEERFGEQLARELYSTSIQLFESLPLALYIPSKLLAVHGGPPITRVLERDSPEEILGDLYSDRLAIEEILWSDPVDEDIVWTYSFRGAGKLWGEKVTREALRKLGIELIVRGHEPCVSGYKLNHSGRVLTLFSMKGYYGNVAAACSVIPLEAVGKADPSSFVVSA
ncbi:MAG: serine/threonine protein phosphatase [Crenarchaeota archaeon]|nr:serine/threonine protein phosphatase [Thermoproteota archaeon]